MAAEKVKNLRFSLESLEIFAVEEYTSHQVQDMSIVAHTSGPDIRRSYLYIEASVEVLEIIIIGGYIIRDHYPNSTLYLEFPYNS